MRAHPAQALQRRVAILFHFKSLVTVSSSRHQRFINRITPKPDAIMDIIFIDELRIATLIGIYPREQSVPQTLEISLQIGTSTIRAGSSDDIRDTIDYAAVVERVRSDLEQRHFHLLEKLAEYVASVVLDDFGAVWTRVSVAKPGVMRGVRRAGVVIERSRPTQTT
jgi:dihydroneopterin aldolase